MFYDCNVINIFFQNEKVKIIADIPYLLPKAYTKLANESPVISDSANMVDCQVSIIINIVKIDTMARKEVTLMASLPSVNSQTIPQKSFSPL